jgi:hypothetical protein
MQGDARIRLMQAHAVAAGGTGAGTKPRGDCCGLGKQDALLENAAAWLERCSAGFSSQPWSFPSSRDAGPAALSVWRGGSEDKEHKSGMKSADK